MELGNMEFKWAFFVKCCILHAAYTVVFADISHYPLILEEVIHRNKICTMLGRRAVRKTKCVP
jgi:hypothetical protein